MHPCICMYSSICTLCSIQQNSDTHCPIQVFANTTFTFICVERITLTQTKGISVSENTRTLGALRGALPFAIGKKYHKSKHVLILVNVEFVRTFILAQAVT
jgi:hypothetical protein